MAPGAKIAAYKVCWDAADRASPAATHRLARGDRAGRGRDSST
jgi:hypothetical protein